jgi:6-pyruvoyltetrahydropterin/6-carboxytetrahydropterin synthase
MPTIRITKIFNFEMAHALWNYHGKCKNIHGHSYILYVTITGNPVIEKGNPEDGMIMDFGALKKLIKTYLIDEFDHTFVINENSPQASELHAMNIPFENIKMLAFQPTSENLIVYFAETIRQLLPDHLSLHSLKLSETDTSFVEWVAE